MRRFIWQLSGIFALAMLFVAVTLFVMAPANARPATGAVYEGNGGISGGPTATPTCVVAGTPGPWVNKTPYPQSVYGAGVASDGTYAYAFGGNTIGGSAHAEAYRYNPATDSWTPLARVATGPDYLFHAIYGDNGKIYLMGGLNNGTANRIYDIAGDSWTSGAPLPTTLYDYAYGYYNGKIYIMGGIDISGGATSAVYAYDIAGDTWTPLASLPQAEFDMAPGVIDGKIYVAGGSLGTGWVDNLYIYDIATNTWSSGAPMLAGGANYPAGVVVGGKLWAIGGGDPFMGSESRDAGTNAAGANSPDSFDTTQIYDPATNSWASGPSLNTARSFADAVVVAVTGGQMALIVGGYNSDSASSLSSVEASTISVSPCSTPTPSNTVTPTDTATSTHTATSTDTSTPTDTVVPTVSPTCTINFSDVHTSDYFYEDVRCVYCLGAVSGYADGTFRPFNNTTRGQMTKIIVLALRIPIATPSGTPTFSDVAPGSAFYDYVETAAGRGIVSGYADGSFRPNNNVTRGQLSKIDVVAANQVLHWVILNPPTATFADVPPGSAFYEYVETAVCHGIISGYSDATFRPGNNAIRAQIAKIVCRTSQNPPDTCSPTATPTSVP